jgi:two-component system, cell cycle response regulator DivK
VLVVDDVDDTRNMYARYFQHLGVQAVTAFDGISALRAVKLEQPDAIVMDLAMPGMTGWEAIRALRHDRKTRDIPIIAVSGHHAEDSALAAGADSYLEKPCLPDAVVGEVMRALSRRDRGQKSGH